MILSWDDIQGLLRLLAIVGAAKLAAWVVNKAIEIYRRL
jgi:hypothetical protein